jgi:PST family polysaccharide transporter
LIIGRRLSTKQLGLYTLGYRAPELAIIGLPAVISGVAYPAYAKIQHDRSALQQSVRKTVQMISWVAIPAGIGLAMSSAAFILTFYTRKWEAAIPVMQLLSLYAMTYTITYNFGDAYKAMGRPDILNKLSISTIVFTIFALFIGSFFGIVGVAWAHLLRVIALGLVQVVIVNRVLGISVWDILEAIFKPVVCASIMALAMAVVAWLLSGGSEIIILILQLVTGLLTYLAASWLLNREVTQTILKMGLQLFGQKPAGGSDAV